jgi:hypothetical protein
MPPRQASRQAQGRQPDVIDVDEYTRSRGPTIIDLTEEPDSPIQRSLYALPPRSSSRNPQPHTQLQQNASGAAAGADHRQSFHGVTSASNNIGIPRTSNIPPRHRGPPPDFFITAERIRRQSMNNSHSTPDMVAAARAGSSRDQAIDLTSDFAPRRPLGDVNRNTLSNHHTHGNIPELIMGEVRANPSALEPFQSGLAHLGRFFNVQNPVPRIHNFIFDVTRVAWASRQDQLNIEVPLGMPDPPPPVPQTEPPRAPPLPLRDGFTRDTGEDKVAVCPSCNEELAYNPGEPASEASPNRRGSRSKRDGEHHFWAVKKCGHVFCSQCFEGRRRKDTGFSHSGNKIACAVDDCSSDVSAKSAWIGIYL